MQKPKIWELYAPAFAIGLALLCLCFVSIQPVRASGGLPHQFDLYLSDYPTSAPHIHPVLKIKANCSLGNKRVSAEEFHELNRFVSPKVGFAKRMSGFEWKQYFAQLEAEAAWQLCMRAVGDSKQELIALAGIPSFSSTCKTKDRLLNSKECYLYQLGESWIPLLFVFDGDKCIRADVAEAVLGEAGSRKLFEDRAAYISKFAIGKTDKQIRLEIKHPIWSKFQSSGNSAIYMLDRVDGLEFVFSSGRCVRVEKQVVASW